jgi:hypothetical protein
MPRQFFIENAVRVVADKDRFRYRIKYREFSIAVQWIEKPTDELLGEALGAGHIISTKNHPVYRDMIAGKELK